MNSQDGTLYRVMVIAVIDWTDRVKQTTYTDHRMETPAPLYYVQTSESIEDAANTAINHNERAFAHSADRTVCRIALAWVAGKPSVPEIFVRNYSELDQGLADQLNEILGNLDE